MARASTPPNTPSRLSVDWDAEEKQQLTQAGSVQMCGWIEVFVHYKFHRYDNI